MVKSLFETKELPNIVPIFPLDKTILLPNSTLQLTIFEPRYLSMCFDVLKQNRFIAIIQNSTDRSDDLQRVGCIGKIVKFEETADYKLLITLKGISRFKVKEELTTTNPYRMISVDYQDYQEDLKPEPAAIFTCKNVFKRLQDYLTRHHVKTNWQELEKMPANVMVNFMAMYLSFSVQEKQLLLEAENFHKRAEVLNAIVKIDNGNSGSNSVN